MHEIRKIVAGGLICLSFLSSVSAQESSKALDPLEVRANREKGAELTQEQDVGDLRLENDQGFSRMEDSTSNRPSDEFSDLNEENPEVEVLDPEKKMAEFFEEDREVSFTEIYETWEKVFSEREASSRFEFDEGEDEWSMESGEEDSYLTNKLNVSELRTVEDPFHEKPRNPYLSQQTEGNPYLSGVKSVRIQPNQPSAPTRQGIRPATSLPNPESEESLPASPAKVNESSELFKKYGSVFED